jgi:hypothetical protein
MNNFRIKKRGDVFYAEKRFLRIFWTSIYKTVYELPKPYYSKDRALDAIKTYIKLKKKKKNQNFGTIVFLILNQTTPFRIKTYEQL